MKMRKVVILAVLLVSGVFFAQEVKPKFEIVGNEVKATYYHDNGTVSQEGNYLNGKLQGVWTSFKEDGSKLVVGEYKNGEKVGKWFFWSDETLSEVDYTKNNIIDVIKWSKDALAKN